MPRVLEPVTLSSPRAVSPLTLRGHWAVLGANYLSLVPADIDFPN